MKRTKAAVKATAKFALQHSKTKKPIPKTTSQQRRRQRRANARMTTESCDVDEKCTCDVDCKHGDFLFPSDITSELAPLEETSMFKEIQSDLSSYIEQMRQISDRHLPTDFLGLLDRDRGSVFFSFSKKTMLSTAAWLYAMWRHPTFIDISVASTQFALSLCSSDSLDNALRLDLIEPFARVMYDYLTSFFTRRVSKILWAVFSIP
jgi:hypothetical protein